MDALRTAIARLEIRPGAILRAEYASADPSPCDVENVALYNVGTGAFAGISRTGILIERAHHPTDALDDLDHRLSFKPVPTEQAPLYWQPRRCLARWDGSWPAISSDQHPEHPLAHHHRERHRSHQQASRPRRLRRARDRRAG